MLKLTIPNRKTQRQLCFGMKSRNLEPLATNSTIASRRERLKVGRYCFARAASCTVKNVKNVVVIIKLSLVYER